MPLKSIKNQEHNIVTAKKMSETSMLIYSFIVLIIGAFFVLSIINKTGNYPWGSDTYGHLFKGQILYDSIKKGHLFLNYNESWYNGIQPFRYWAPLPYYILAIINLMTNDIILTFNVFVAFIFVFGGTGWLLLGKYMKRQDIGLILGVMWFFAPYNLRILFSEGNFPFIIVNSMVPYGLMFYYKSVNDQKIKNLIILGIIMHLITLSHAMLSAMFGISLFILALMDVMVNKKLKENFISLIYAFLGIMTSAYWLYPALKGGLMAQDKGAVSSVMEAQTHPFTISLNPLIRFSNYEIYYYGLAFAIVILMGILFSRKHSKIYFLGASIILLGTNTLAVPILKNLPLNQLFWMNRFTAISIGMIFVGLISWKSARKSVLMFLILILIVDSLASFHLVGHNRQKPENIVEDVEYASNIATQRIAVLDNSSFGSIPSYYIYYGNGKVKNQVYGWAWQGATTSKNIMKLNTSLENEYYEYMLDRSLELGADTLVIRNSYINHKISFEEAYKKMGYEKVRESELCTILKYPINHIFGTTVKYSGLAVGKYSSNLMYIFPSIQEGKSIYIDDYTFNELKNYKVIYLSGFSYKNKLKTENLLKKLAKTNTKVVIDTTGLDEKNLFGISVQTITLEKNYKNLYYNKQKINLKNFPQDYEKWKTNFAVGTRSIGAEGEIEHRIIQYIGKVDNINIISLNLPYYAFLTKDKNIINILENTLNLTAFELPKRNIKEISIEKNEDILNIKADKEIIIPIAAIDAFEIIHGNYSVENNLIKSNSKNIKLKVGYPYLSIGIGISLVSVIIISLLTHEILKSKENRRQDRRKRKNIRRRKRNRKRLEQNKEAIG